MRSRHVSMALTLVGALAATLAGVAITGAASAQKKGGTAKMVTTKSGLKYQDTVVGKGATPKSGQAVTVNYTGWLDDHGKHGAKFDSSVDRHQAFTFTIGKHKVIAGWDEGVMSMHVGGKRTLIIPPALGYGERAIGPIPPNSTLIFDVELLAVK